MCMTLDLKDSNGGSNIFSNPPNSGALIANCAMGMINTGIPLSYEHNDQEKSDLSELSVFCVACKNGFAPKFNPRFPLHIYECAAISQCNNNGDAFVNGCSECNAGYIWSWNENGVDYTVCKDDQSPKNDNCLAADTNEVCQYCKQGYSLNYDNKCEKIPHYACSEDSTIGKAFPFRDLSFINKAYSKNFGCNSCETGKIALFRSQDLYACSVSPYITPASPAGSSIYIENCEKYGNEGINIICKVCKPDYIITTAKKCVATTGNTKFSNCDIAYEFEAGQFGCFKCATDYVNVNNSCVVPNITGCSQYSDKPETEVKCTACEPGKFLSQNTCNNG